MLDWISRRCIYFRFSQSEVHALCLYSGREFRDTALVALQIEGTKRIVLAVGSETGPTQDRARSLHAPGVIIVRPFQHDRLVVDDFEVAEALLRYVFSKISPRIQRRPDVIMHPLHKFPSSLTDIEKRALHDLAASAGAAGTAVHEGPELTREQAMQLPVIPSAIRR